MNTRRFSFVSPPISSRTREICVGNPLVISMLNHKSETKGRIWEHERERAIRSARSPAQRRSFARSTGDSRIYSKCTSCPFCLHLPAATFLFISCIVHRRGRFVRCFVARDQDRFTTARCPGLAGALIGETKSPSDDSRELRSGLVRDKKTLDRDVRASRILTRPKIPVEK